MLTTKCIVLICGPPACLKSTLIRILRLIFNRHQISKLQYICVEKLCEIFCKKQETNNKYNFLCFDDLFYGYEKDIIQNESNWKLYRLLIANEIEKIILSDAQHLSMANLKYSSQILDRLYRSVENFHRDSILVIEDNFYYSSMRHRYHQMAQRAQIGFTSIHLYSTLNIALQRNQKRELSKRVSNSSIENIYSKYDLSDDDLVINTTCRGLTTEHLIKILQRIQQACDQPEQQVTIIDDEQRQIATQINHRNLIYQSDQRLRKFISKYLKEEFSKNEKFNTTNEKKQYAEMVNDKKQTFLELLKQNLISLDDKEDIETVFEQFLQENN